MARPPLGAFRLFATEERRREGGPGAFQGRAAELAARWRGLPPSAREEWEERSRVEHEAAREAGRRLEPVEDYLLFLFTSWRAEAARRPEATGEEVQAGVWRRWLGKQGGRPQPMEARAEE
jgi:hypothetical protein